MPNFISFVASIAERAYEEKLCTHSPSLFDALRTEAFALENCLQYALTSAECTEQIKVSL